MTSARVEASGDAIQEDEQPKSGHRKMRMEFRINVEKLSQIDHINQTFSAQVFIEIIARGAGESVDLEAAENESIPSGGQRGQEDCEELALAKYKAQHTPSKDFAFYNTFTTRLCLPMA